MRAKPSVLFLCAHNAVRSQLAEAILRHRAGDRFEVSSAGLDPTAVHPLTRQVLHEIGIDSRALHAKSVGRFLGKHTVTFAVLLGKESEDRCPRLYPFATRTVRWPLDDPALVQGSEELRLSSFRRARDHLDARLRDWLGGLAHLS